MDTMKAFMRGEANRGKTEMVFDWEKAAKIIKERNISDASAGLEDDWDYTGGLIWENKKIVDKENTYTFLASTWAIPQLEIDGEYIDCWRYKNDTPDWNAKTYWPIEALSIINDDNHMGL